MTAQNRIALANYDRLLEPPDIPTTPEPETEQGYHGIGANKGIFVPEEFALIFALKRSGLKISDKERFESEWGEGGKEFVKRYFSISWTREKQHETD